MASVRNSQYIKFLFSAQNEFQVELFAARESLINCTIRKKAVWTAGSLTVAIGNLWAELLLLRHILPLLVLIMMAMPCSPCFKFVGNLDWKKYVCLSRPGSFLVSVSSTKHF